MSEFSKVLSNPYVLGGGALLGVFLLMSAGKGGGGGSSGYSGGGGGEVPYNSAALTYNMAALSAGVEQARIVADRAKTEYALDTTRHVALYNSINNHDTNIAKVAAQNIISNEGILKTQIASHAAVQMDMQQNMARLGIAGLQVHQTQIQSNASVQIAKVQAKAQVKASLFKAVGDVAGTAAKALMYA
jgi:hypothetical protein